MPINVMSLGLIPSNARLASWAFQQLYQIGKPHIAEILKSPTVAIERVGDLLIWNGDKGTKVIGGLEQLTENTKRMESLVQSVQTTQIQMYASLGALQAMSIVGMGVTALSSAILYNRLKTIDDHCVKLHKLLKRVAAHLNVNDLALLKSGISHMRRYEDDGQRDRGILNAGTRDCNMAATTYAGHLRNELASRDCELPAVSYFNRCLLLALASEVRCLSPSDNLPFAKERIGVEQPLFREAASAMFNRVLGKSPERYLDPALRSENITLELLAEIFQQARQAGVIDKEAATSVTGIFEELRPRLFNAGRGGWRSVFPMLGRARIQCTENLRYLMTCLEEASRVEAMRIRIEEAIKGKYSPRDLEKQIAALKSKYAGTSESDAPVMAYAFT